MKLTVFLMVGSAILTAINLWLSFINWRARRFWKRERERWEAAIAERRKAEL